MNLILFCLALTLSLQLYAQDLAPWYDNSFVLETSSQTWLQSYRQIKSSHKKYKADANDLFLSGQAAISLFEWRGALAATGAFTHAQHGYLDNLRANLSYLVKDDVAGDPLSILIGVRLEKAFDWSVKDISSFHHADLEAMAYMSIGKETACMEELVSRWYSCLLVSIAENVSPWASVKGSYLRKLSHVEALEFFATYLVGFGSEAINPERFKGYGEIKHRSLDLGIKYSLEIDRAGKLSLAYQYRPYAYNFPAEAHILAVSYECEFGVL